MDDSISLVVGILAIIAFLAAIFLVRKVSTYAELQRREAENEALDSLIWHLVQAAEQTLKENDIDGSKRLDFVERTLIKSGYDLTDIVKAKIASHVFKLNNLKNSKKDV